MKAEIANTPQELKAIKCMEVLNIYKPYIEIYKITGDATKEDYHGTFL